MSEIKKRGRKSTNPYWGLVQENAVKEFLTLGIIIEQDVPNTEFSKTRRQPKATFHSTRLGHLERSQMPLSQSTFTKNIGRDSAVDVILVPLTDDVSATLAALDGHGEADVNARRFSAAGGTLALGNDAGYLYGLRPVATDETFLSRIDLVFYVAAVVGWYTHLLLDGLFRLFPQDPKTEAIEYYE